MQGIQLHYGIQGYVGYTWYTCYAGITTCCTNTSGSLYGDYHELVAVSSGAGEGNDVQLKAKSKPSPKWMKAGFTFELQEREFQGKN